MNISTKRMLLGALFVQTAWMAGCSKMRSSKQAPYLARVGSDHLTLNEARSHVSSFSMKHDSAEALAAYRKEWIRQHLILNEAARLNLAGQKEIQQKLKDAHDEVLQQALQQSVTAHFKKTFTVSDSEAHQYFQEHKKKWTLHERYIKFRHVETPRLANARRARRELQQDSVWTEVAEKYSSTPQSKIAKSSRIWPVSAITAQIPVLQRYITRLDSGQYSPIRRSNGTYHFIEVTQVRETGSAANPDWFIDQIKEWLIREKERNYYHSYLKKLYFKAKENNELEVYNVDKNTN